MRGEKGRELVERDKLHPIVKVNVPSIRNNEKFLRLGSFLERRAR